MSSVGGDRWQAQDEHYRARRLAGIEGYTLHDHRHTAAVYLARAGMPLPQLAQQLRHATIAMTMRYARFHADYTDVGRYFDRVAQALGRESAPARVQSRVPIGQQARQESLANARAQRGHER